MEDLKIREVSYYDMDQGSQYCFDERGEKYYIGWESEPTFQVSSLFKDLSWIRKHFGVDKAETSIITFDSLNEGRRNSIEEYKKCIKAGIPKFERHKLGEDGKIRINPETSKPYSHTRLSQEGKKYFQSQIDKGLYCLCKIVK